MTHYTVAIEPSQYGTATPTARIHDAASERAARASLYRLAAAVEDRSEGFHTPTKTRGRGGSSSAAGAGPAVCETAASANKRKGAQSAATAEEMARTGGGTSNSRLGRPRRNLISEMEKIISQFEGATDSDSTWFGENYRAREI